MREREPQTVEKYLLGLIGLDDIAEKRAVELSEGSNAAYFSSSRTWNGPRRTTNVRGDGRPKSRGLCAASPVSDGATSNRPSTRAAARCLAVRHWPNCSTSTSARERRIGVNYTAAFSAPGKGTRGPYREHAVLTGNTRGVPCLRLAPSRSQAVHVW